MLSDITLQPETQDDIPFLLSVYASTRADEMAIVPWTQEQKDEFVRMQFGFQRQYYLENYGGATFDIVIAGGLPAGRLYVYRGTDELRVIDIAILPEFRGKGIGGLLMGRVLAEAGARGVAVSIHVERTNRARHLYERLGFRLAGEQGPVYLLMEWRP